MRSQEVQFINILAIQNVLYFYGMGHPFFMDKGGASSDINQKSALKRRQDTSIRQEYTGDICNLIDDERTF